MSTVTSFLIVTNCHLEETVKVLKDEGFKEVSDAAGGSKFPQADAWMAGFNYYDESQLWAKFKNLQWDGPVWIFVNREHEDTWSVWTAKNCYHQIDKGEDYPWQERGSGISVLWSEPHRDCKWCKENVNDQA